MLQNNGGDDLAVAADGGFLERGERSRDVNRLYRFEGSFSGYERDRFFYNADGGGQGIESHWPARELLDHFQGVGCHETGAGIDVVARQDAEALGHPVFVAFFEEQLDLWEKITLNAGVRFDASSAFGDNIETEAYPKAGVSYLVSQDDWFGNLAGSTVGSVRRSS